MERKSRYLLAALPCLVLIAAAISGAGCIITTNDDPIYGYFAEECADGFLVYNMVDTGYTVSSRDFDGNVVTKVDGFYKLKKTKDNWYETENGKIAFSVSEDANTLNIYINGELDGTAERMINLTLPARKNGMNDAGDEEPIVGTWYHDYGPDKDISSVYLTLNGNHTASYVTTYPDGRVVNAKDNNWMKTGDRTYQISGNANTYGGSERTFTVSPDGTKMKVSYGPTDYYSVEFTRYST